MENKKTTELIDELQHLNDEDWNVGGKYEVIIEILKDREPFASILNREYDESIPHLAEQVAALQETVKKLKRHKHDDKSGDVLVRI